MSDPGAVLALDIAERLRISAHGCPPDVFARLREWAEATYIFENPAYWHARLHRHPCKHIPRRMELARLSDTEIELPRGANRDLKRLLAEIAPGLPVQISDRRSAPPSELLNLTVELRPYQQDAVERAVQLRDGVLVAPTGSGKTVMAMGLIARLQVRTLVLVHTRTLLSQTCAVIERSLGVRAGRIGAGEDELGDVTVATVQTFLRRDPEELRDHFGLVLLDEAHHCPATTFTEVIERFRARHRIGLTATPERADALHPLMYATLGPELYRVKPSEMVDLGSLCAASVLPVETTFCGGRMVDRGRMISRLCEDPQRNQDLATAIAATRGERSLVLSERVQHCQELGALLRSAQVPAFVLVGAHSEQDRQKTLAAFLSTPRAVLVATGSLMGEGFDCPDLDTLYLAVPSGNTTRTTQALGRILRPHAAKTLARVFDFVDSQTPGLHRTLRSRLAVYRKHQAQVLPAVGIASLRGPPPA